MQKVAMITSANRGDREHRGSAAGSNGWKACSDAGAKQGNTIRRLMTRAVSAVVFLAFLCAGGAYAQTASVTGAITDPSGAVVPQASVQLLRPSTGAKMATTSNSDGVYTFPFVTPGVYTITVQKSGFKSSTRPNITLTVAQSARINFTLEVGSATQTVEVSGGTSQINTTDASVSTVIDRHFIENLPLNGRSFQSLLFLTPGVAMNVGTSTAANTTGPNGFNSGTVGQFVVNGQRPDSNYWTVDGVSGNIGMIPGTPGAGAAGAIGATNSLGGTSALISVDALEEFRVVTSTYAPEFGHTTGGQIVLQSRAGTNQFHGALFDYFRNTDLDATDWFADRFGLPKSAEHQNDFGGVVGGPILKNRAFFFFSYEGLRLRQPYTQNTVVPTLAARAAAIPAMKPFLDVYPLPKPGEQETPPGSGLVPYGATFSNPSNADATSLRVDYQISKNLHFFGRYDHAPSNYKIRGGGVPANDVNISSRITKTATGGLTWVISPEVVNNTRVNYSVDGGSAHAVTDTFGGGTPVPANGLPSPFTYAQSLYYFDPVFGAGLTVENGNEGTNYQRQWDVVDDVSVQKGNHSLKFGVDYRQLSPNYGQGTFELIPIFATDMAKLDSGIADITVVSHYGPGRFRLKTLGFYGQDTWRVNPRLNLTYGLRWDVNYAPETLQGIPLPGLSGFNLNDLSNIKQVPGTPAFHTRYGQVAPRVGGAYRAVTTPGKELVIRGGFGVFYGLMSTELINGYAIDEPFYPFGTNAFYFGNAFPVLPGTPVAQLPPIEPPNAVNGNALYGLDPNLKAPYALEYSGAVEQSLGAAQNLTLSYIGSVNRRQMGVEQLTSFPPNYPGGLYLIAGVGHASYNALQVQFQRALANGLQALGSYTWSHCIDLGSYGDYANGSLGDINANKGDCDYDLRNTFSGALVYQIPTLTGNRFTRAILGGWSTQNIVQAFSGPPMDVNDANFAALENSSSAVIIRPDVVPGVARYLTGPQYPGGKALNPAAFTNPPVGPTGLPLRQGDLGRNAVRALGMVQWNLALHRDFPITERVILQFRASFFNVLNHPNFAAYNPSFETGNALFGQATTMLNTALGGNQASGAQSSLYQPGGPRSGQLALKLTF